MVEIYYFGCWGDAGHYLFRPGMDMLKREERIQAFGLKWHHIDGAFVPKNFGEIAHGNTAGSLVSAGWTYMSTIDYTVDKRQGSHSTFFVRGDLTKQAALAIVIEAFPEVCKRIGWTS